MHAKMRHYLSSVSELLRNVTASSQIEIGQIDVLRTAGRLVDCLLIEASIGPEATKKYLSAVQRLLPKIEQTVPGIDGADTDGIGSHIAQLKALDGESAFAALDTFLLLVAQLQRELCEIDATALNQLTQALMQSDAEFASTMFSEGLVLASNTDADEGPGAANRRNYDEHALLAFILDKIPGNEGANIASSSFISGGMSKFTMAIELSKTGTVGDQIVLRGDAGNQFSGATVAYEHRLHKVLFDQGVCVPRPLALEETGTVFGAPFMLSERAAGTIIGHMFKMPEPDEKVLVDIAKQLAIIHSVPTDVFGDWIENATARTSEKVLAWIELGYQDFSSSDVNSATFERAFAWLKRNATLNDRGQRTLVHGDYGLNNILIENSEVKAVLDWEFAHIGNPAYDLAYFHYMAEALGSWELFLESYASTGATLPDEEQLNYNLVLTVARLGVQCCQVQSVFDAGLANSADAARVIANQYVNESILRLSGALERVL